MMALVYDMAVVRYLENGELDLDFGQKEGFF